MANINIGPYCIRLHEGDLAQRLLDTESTAVLKEEYDAVESDNAIFSLSVARGIEWPFLDLVQRYSPSGPGFPVGVLLVPETDRLFVGAGTRLVAYDLVQPCRLWIDEVAAGFWFWSRHGSVILMGAELELSAWDLIGRRLWTNSVEPPWTLSVSADIVSVDIMGTVSRLELQTGRPIK